MCRLLEVTRQGYYNYLKQLTKPYKHTLLLAEIKKIIAEDECNDTYGSMRIWEALIYRKNQNDTSFPFVPSERTIYRLMGQHGLIHKPNRKPNSITKADKEAQKSDDLIKRDFTAKAPLTKVVTDITEMAAGRMQGENGLNVCLKELWK